MADEMPDHVGELPDGSVITVLGADGFAAVGKGGVWSRETAGWFTDPDKLAVIDPDRVEKLSEEARQALGWLPCQLRLDLRAVESPAKKRQGRFMQLMIDNLNRNVKNDVLTS